MIMDSDILDVLQKEVTKAVDKVHPVKYLNVNFRTPKDGKWWEVIYLPSNVPDEFWASGKTYQGVLRLILHWPQDNAGIYKPIDEVKRVAKHFEKGVKFYKYEEPAPVEPLPDGEEPTVVEPEVVLGVTILDNPDLTSIIEDTPNLILPLTIRYNCFIV